MKTIDRKVRGFGSRPFAAFLLLGIVGFGFDLALNAGNYAENRIASVVESPFLATPAFAAEGADETKENQSSQTNEAKARLLFKKNESTALPHYWVEGLERFGRFTE